MEDGQASGSIHVQSNNPHWRGDVWKVRSGGGGRVSIPARALHITWGNDPRYWEWLNIQSKVGGFQFEEGAMAMAMLQQVNWLEVKGELEVVNMEVATWSYRVYYVMKFNEDAFGWSHAPIKFNLKCATAENENENENVMMMNLQQYKDKPGMWHRIYVGDFKVNANSSMIVEVGMSEVATDWWKGGLLLGGISLEII